MSYIKTQEPKIKKYTQMFWIIMFQYAAFNWFVFFVKTSKIKLIYLDGNFIYSFKLFKYTVLYFFAEKFFC